VRKGELNDLCIQLIVKDVKHNAVATTETEKGRRSIWGWIAIALLVVVVTIAVAIEWTIHNAEPILKGRVIETLSARFDSRVTLDRFHVSVLKGLEISGDGLKIYPPDAVVAAGAQEPLITLSHFGFHADLRGLFQKPMRVDTVHVDRMTVAIPPKQIREQAGERKRHFGKITILVDRIDFDDSKLVIGTVNPDKVPLEFDLGHIVMRNVGPAEPWKYDATLINAVPHGDIHATGTFGPWVNESPGESAVTGNYLFENADLSTIKGIGGMLSSTGEFSGQLDRIVVDGTTETPDFWLDTAKHKVPLHTKFHAMVDGMNGDTYLQPVEAKLGESQFSCSGSVVSIKGLGHKIDLNVDVPDGRIQDFLELGVKTQPVVMTGRLGMKTKLHISPGHDSVTKRITLRGHFDLRSIHFTNSETQDKVDMLSLRARGHPKEAKPGAEDVPSEMTGQFAMGNERLDFPELVYTLPGADVTLKGVYSLDGEQFDFDGKIRTKAALSQMVATWWKSWLLKPLDPRFRKNGAGAEIPVKISGTREAPKFELELRHKDKGE